MSGGQDAATALYVSSMAMRALPGAGWGRELRFFLRGGWRVSIVLHCLVSPCCCADGVRSGVSLCVYLKLGNIALPERSRRARDVRRVVEHRAKKATLRRA